MSEGDVLLPLSILHLKDTTQCVAIIVLDIAIYIAGIGLNRVGQSPTHTSGCRREKLQEKKNRIRQFFILK